MGKLSGVYCVWKSVIAVFCWFDGWVVRYFVDIVVAMEGVLVGEKIRI